MQSTERKRYRPRFQYESQTYDQQTTNKAFYSPYHMPLMSVQNIDKFLGVIWISARRSDTTP